MRFAFLVLLLSCVFIPACDEPSAPKSSVTVPEAVDFRPESLATAKALVPTLRGQLLYMPVYSNLPYSKGASSPSTALEDSADDDRAQYLCIQIWLPDDEGSHSERRVLQYEDREEHRGS